MKYGLFLFLSILITIQVNAKLLSDTVCERGKACATVVHAKHRIDKLLDLRDNKGNLRIDTNYMQRLPQRLRFKVIVNGSGSEIKVKGKNGAGTFMSDLSAQNKYTLSFNASYRGLSAGFAVNPAHFTGKNKDYEFNMNAYGNTFGADVIFQSAKTFEGNIHAAQGDVIVPTGLVSQDMLTVNAYYVFNSRRFSYPAAFTQSWIQKRSSGSFMLGFSFVGGRIKSKHDDNIGNPASELKMVNAGIGIGYGYNWVLRNNWLIHLSSLPELVVFSRCRLNLGERSEKMPYTFPNIIAVGRIAVVRHLKKYFFGISAVVNTSTVGDHDKLQLSNTKWRARLFTGIKL